MQHFQWIIHIGSLDLKVNAAGYSITKLMRLIILINTVKLQLKHLFFKIEIVYLNLLGLNITKVHPLVIHKSYYGNMYVGIVGPNTTQWSILCLRVYIITSMFHKHLIFYT